MHPDDSQGEKLSIPRYVTQLRIVHNTISGCPRTNSQEEHQFSWRQPSVASTIHSLLTVARSAPARATIFLGRYDSLRGLTSGVPSGALVFRASDAVSAAPCSLSVYSPLVSLPPASAGLTHCRPPRPSRFCDAPPCFGTHRAFLGLRFLCCRRSIRPAPDGCPSAFLGFGHSSSYCNTDLALRYIARRDSSKIGGSFRRC